ncbi:MAG TPA: DUF2625 family protein [Symbiobacteriaceae bacterium]|nr:DUF2625 family protein [Symbiobacteriaceae bacterium]
MNRTLAELVDTMDPAWPLVQHCLAAARNRAEVLPVARDVGENTILQLQITSRSTLGAVALETGGLLLNHGWLRFLGAGHDRLAGSLLTWNGYAASPVNPVPRGYLIVAYDLAGGFFALNGDAFPGRQGDAWYLAPDTLEWEPLELEYTALLHWATQANLDEFYHNVRWPGWEAEAESCPPDHGFHFYPPLFSRCDAARRSRRTISMYELWSLHQ